MYLELDKNTMEKQIDLMYPNLPNTASLIIFTIPEKKTRYYKVHEMANIAEDLKDIVKHQNIFFNVLPQDIEDVNLRWREENKENNKIYRGRGYKETTISIQGFWLDIDYKDANHAKENLPSREEAIKFVKSLPIKHTYIVESGHGFHVYYLFEEIWVFRDNIDRDKAEKLSKGFQEYVRQLGKDNGWNLDQTGDLMRMLRLAGTYNHKDPSNPIPVTISEIHTENRYTVENFESLVKTKENILSSNEKTTEQDFKPANIDLIKEGCPFMRNCKDNAANLDEQSWYASLSILVNCEDGEARCHEWSVHHPDYSEEETQLKLEHAYNSAGPRTCQNISEMTNNQFCSSCKFNGKVKSPIVLGLEKIDKHLTEEEAIKTAKKAITLVSDGDFGAHLTKESISAFAVLNKRNPSEFARLKQELKMKNVSFSEFNRLVKAESRKLGLKNNKGNKELALFESDSDDGKPSSVLIPHGYAVRKNGIFKIIPREDVDLEIQISYYPIFVNGKFRDIDEGKELIQVSWEKEKKYSAIIDREYIADSRKLISLASEGFPVHSGNSSELVAYLAALEALNESNLQVSYTSSHLGWQGRNGDHGFLLNDYLIDNSDSQTSNDNQSITFNPNSPGERQAITGFHQRGSFEEWKKQILKIVNYPRVLLLFYASFVPVLLEPLSASNFVIELANRTSTGKTSSLRVVASVWGNPDERASDSIIWSWDATNVWLERISAILNGIPLLLDDTKRAKYPNTVADMIYSISNGKGKGRGNLKGISNTKSWRTILISTAETPSIYLTKDGGTRGRILEITGMPFGKANEYTREIVTKINIGIKDNYGFAGSIFVKYVMENRDKWPEWKSELHEKIAKYSSKAKGEVSGRLSEYAALIEFTKAHVDKVLELPFLFDNPIEKLWDEIVNESKDATGERECLNHVLSWAFSKAESFEGRHVVLDSEIRIPSYGWSGKWIKGESWNEIAFLPSVLKNIIIQSGYDPEAIFRGWKELRWIEVNENNSHKYAKQVRFFDNPTWMIVIKRDAVDAAENNSQLFDEKKD